MLNKTMIMLAAISLAVFFGCKKLEESGITIDKAITVLEYAKTAKQLINAGNANDIAGELMKQIDNDKGGDEEADVEEETSEEEAE
ncbi:MAG TPA: hypothetical protein PLM53_12230 [Spirochaetota bacterium]|nr:hypothetical protein [Spirochaetota bacterium]HPC39888.1 hypothetical protein [Spirochaetota bacterium]HPL18048.1 hypothetical protein [Spirochaetota bacterium]HQF08936.1 hypothetical protein [Spirochaetota bacterium]HQH97862.1 hypothetical protein [Spirochaetota bacterium]